MRAPDYIAPQRLYLTADGERVVAAGDPAGHTLFAAVGAVIPAEAAERYDLREIAVVETHAPSGPPEMAALLGSARKQR